MRRAFANRVDNTAKTLIAHAKSLGADYLTLNGDLDGVLKVGPIQWLVDWKTPGASLTPKQARLVAAGWRIHFISTPEQLEEVVKTMRRMAA
ncbi:MAG: hypothetical protein RLY20_2486 [Verrucomicrobiota bacterium]|jgi:hypothetical protein